MSYFSPNELMEKLHLYCYDEEIEKKIRKIFKIPSEEQLIMVWHIPNRKHRPDVFVVTDRKIMYGKSRNPQVINISYINAINFDGKSYLNFHMKNIVKKIPVKLFFKNTSLSCQQKEFLNHIVREIKQ